MSTNTEHPLTVAEIGRIWDKHAAYWYRDWFRTLASSSQVGISNALRAVYDLAVERTHADDGWEPLGRDDELRVGDEVRSVSQGITSTGVVARVDQDGDPRTAEGWNIGVRAVGTWSVRRAPVAWYRLPTKHPAHLTDVTAAETVFCDRMSLDRDGNWIGVDSEGYRRDWVPRDITSCTLDGTRLIRDGKFEDGTLRFYEEVGE